MVTLLVSVLLAYHFVPAPEDNYTTVRVGSYVGVTNAAWIGHATAMMTSVFLWLIGFYLFSNGVRRDRVTGVGQIIATTSVTNFRYLTAKAGSNFLVLMTIVSVVFVVAVGLVVFQGGAYEISVAQLLLPYLLAVVPSMIFLSAVTVLFEVVFGRRTNVMNVVFFFTFAAVIALTNAAKNPGLFWFDPLGVNYLAGEIQTAVQALNPGESSSITVGFNFGDKKTVDYFLFAGSAFGPAYVASRLLWVALAFGVLRLAAALFDRFNERRFAPRKSVEAVEEVDLIPPPVAAGINRADLAAATKNYGIWPLVKTELLLLLRKGPRWLWFVNLGLFIALVFVPLSVALKFLLPILLFLQIGRWADLATKEEFFGTDAFVYSTYQPLRRLLTAQVSAAVLLGVVLALPVILRLLIGAEPLAALQVVLGILLLVAFAVCSGIVTGGKRFFEVVFFVVTYLLLAGGDVFNYVAGPGPEPAYALWCVGLAVGLLTLAFAVRSYRIRTR